MAVKVALQYGIFGGPLRAKKFQQALSAAGYIFEPDATKADIVICHSAGCFWLPDIALKQKIVLIDPPYWPEKTIRERGHDRIRSNRQYRRFGYPTQHYMQRMLITYYYAMVDAPRNIRIMRHGPRYDLPAVLQNRQGILVRNEHDDWLTPNLDDLAARYPDFRIVTLPGDHDDCWYNPQPYVNLLKQLQ